MAEKHILIWDISATLQPGAARCLLRVLSHSDLKHGGQGKKKNTFFFFLKYEKSKPCIMGSKEKKAAAVDGYCWERVNTSFTGAVRHCPHADRSLQTCVDTAVCSQRDLYACWRENKTIVQLFEVRMLRSERWHSELALWVLQRKKKIMFNILNDPTMYIIRNVL